MIKLEVSLLESHRIIAAIENVAESLRECDLKIEMKDISYKLNAQIVEQIKQQAENESDKN